MNMSNEEKKINLAVSRRRYAKLTSKKEKSLFLDQFCATTGLERKHAIKQLRKSGVKRKQGRRRIYGTDSRLLLTEIWKLSGKLCGKLLHAVVPCWLESLNRHGVVDPVVEKQLLLMSASTMDRLLRHAKHRSGRGRRRNENLETNRRRVPLKVDVWPLQTPSEAGWIEADTVAHCGGSMAGSFIWSAIFTDVATHWTEIRCVWNKGAEAVCQRLGEVFSVLPFEIKAMNTDNGSEFLNHHMAKNFPELCPDACHTRSRPYRKNDNAHVEQKNGNCVRRLFGYGRFDQRELVDLMNEIAIFQSLFNNLYSPTQRLLSKRREGRKYIKQFEKLPKTPAMRILECPDIDERHKNQVRLMLAQNDPISLRNTIEMKKRELLKLDYKIANQNKTELTCDISSGRARGLSQKHEASPPKGPPKKARAWCHPL